MQLKHVFNDEFVYYDYDSFCSLWRLKGRCLWTIWWLISQWGWLKIVHLSLKEGGIVFRIINQAPVTLLDLFFLGIGQCLHSHTVVRAFIHSRIQLCYLLRWLLPLPYRKIYDVNIDKFEEKPWRIPGADITDYFNFSLNENTWKQYCSSLVSSLSCSQ